MDAGFERQGMCVLVMEGALESADLSSGTNVTMVGLQDDMTYVGSAQQWDTDQEATGVVLGSRE